MRFKQFDGAFNPKQYHRLSQIVTMMLLVSCTVVVPLAYAGSGESDRPNIVWIVVEDMSTNFGCYGEDDIETPNVDRLADNGVLFRNAYVTSPICSPSRSALVTGMHQTTIGVHNHRSSRGERKISLPEYVTSVPRLFQEAGYYAVNIGGVPPSNKGGKKDYNFEWDGAIYDDQPWSNRADGQPFFAQIQLRGGKLRNVEQWYDEVAKGLDDVVKPHDVTVPPYYPDDPVIMNDWARYLNAVRYTDKEVGRILALLEEQGLRDNTYVFFFTDHGISHVRGKQFLYEEGAHIPFVVNGPGLDTGEVRDDLMLHIDAAAASLDLAGIDVPDWMEARPLFSDAYKPRDFVVLARDRADETIDRIRAVREGHYKYIRNGFPDLPYTAPNRYKDQKEIMQRMRELSEAGELNEAEAKIMSDQRPKEELYNLEKDPDELRNLASDPAEAERLARMRGLLDGWQQATGDQGRTLESVTEYDQEMSVYLDKLERISSKQAEILKTNIKWHKNRFYNSVGQ
jgi:arylsulfatase A-like enzyme